MSLVVRYSLEDEEDMSIKECSKLWVYQGRYRIEVNRVNAGNWVLIEGIDESVAKTSTLTSAKGDHEAEIFRVLRLLILNFHP